MDFDEATGVIRKERKERQLELLRKLEQLGSRVLARELVELSEWDEQAAEMVERLVTEPKVYGAQFKRKLKALTEGREFVGWRGLSDYSHELSFLIQQLVSSGVDPEDGLEAMIAFFEADETVFENCLDDGIVGDVFTTTARDAFIRFAAQVPDKESVRKEVVDLIQRDNYGVRDCLIKVAGQYLDEVQMRVMVENLSA